MDQKLLTVVPPDLKKLVRLVARAFYSPEHFLVLDILAKFPCVTEDDLYQLLRFELKKLRIVLAGLKKDKLIQNIQRVESVESNTGEKKNITVQYLYINYKVFVNVVKYKLYRIREKIQSEERKSRNRMLYLCPNCQSSFTDLEVDRLLDPVDQVLKCNLCRTVLEEDVPEGDVVDARSLLSSLNDQLKPILRLLKETENMNLAPEILEPEPQGINKQVLEASQRHSAQQPGMKASDQWTTSKADDMYGDQMVSVNFGDGDDKTKKGKAAPEWMTESTVYAENRVGGDDVVSMETTTKTNVSDGEIMALLINETKKPREHVAPPTSARDNGSSSSSDEGSSSSSSEEESELRQFGSTSYAVNRQGNFGANKERRGEEEEEEEEEEDSEFESDEDDMSMKIGNKVYQISDITPDIVAQMTPKEKQKYTELYQQAYSNYY